MSVPELCPRTTPDFFYIYMRLDDPPIEYRQELLFGIYRILYQPDVQPRCILARARRSALWQRGFQRQNF